MTTLQALQSTIGVNYPNLDMAAQKALIDQGLTGSESYTSSFIKQVDLACAGLCLAIITSADISEGGYRVSISDKASLISMRKAILTKYGISDGTTGFISNGSNIW
jgi:hypothetical protein